MGNPEICESQFTVIWLRNLSLLKNIPYTVATKYMLWEEKYNNYLNVF